MRLIRPALEGRGIRASRVTWLRSLGGVGRPAFARAVEGARIAGLRRRAKQIVVHLEREGSPAGALLVHLRMTGRLYVEPSDATPSSYVRVSLDLDDGMTLQFLDVRKFGRFVYSAQPEARLGGLGPEPLDAAFTPASLHDALQTRRRLIKPLLLDQSFVAGLGNIYVDEALHRARLHPLRHSDSVRRPQAAALHAAIQEVLTAAIERQGSSFDRFYRTPEGQPGGYQHEFQVYGRTGNPCRRCGAIIRRMVVGQRGTHLCPTCQRPPSPHHS
jgi:formamidopyrimidine-DNA glycosylase